MKRLAVVVVASVVALGASELALRTVDYRYSPVRIGDHVRDDWREEHAFQDRNLTYDRTLIWRPRSGQFSPFNPQGFRGAPVRVPKPAGTLRIFALGDSNTFGWDVDEGANWPSQLQRLLASTSPGVEVVNAGVWGYSSFQGARRFQELLEYEPDVVLVSFGANDAHQVRVPDAEYVARHERIELLSRATARARIAQLLVQAWDLAGMAAASGKALHARVAPDEYAGHLRAIIRSGRDHGVTVVLLTRPFVGSSTDPASWKTHAPAYNAITRQIARDEGVLLVDVHAHFASRPELFDDESHFGVEGHRLAAELIAEALRRR
jgi:lysophospholipase L1-like esterase